jgi:formylglycine-generating enzyme required for sulfatase activity
VKREYILALMMITFSLASCKSSPNDVPLPTVDTGIDPESWALIPGGEFLMGQHEHETMVDYDYEMMVTHVTNAQFARYLNEALAGGTIKIVENQVVGYYPGDDFNNYEHELEIKAGDWVHMPLDEPELRVEYDGAAFTAKGGYENHPVVFVSWFGAKGYCESYGWRLPSEVEWEKSARGTDSRPFPWGDEIKNDNANFYNSHDQFEKVVGKMGDTTPVGYYNGGSYDGDTTLDSTSPYGLYDMAGNVWQWTGNVYEDQHYRYMRGGSKAEYGYNLRVWMRNSAGPDYYGLSVGFRCARDPVE